MDQQPLALPPVEEKRQHKKIFLVLLLAFLALLLWQFAGSSVKSTIAQVEGNVYPVSAPFGGTVAEVLVKNGDFVEKGQMLFLYDAEPLKAALNEALAGLNLASQGKSTPASQDPNLKQADIQAAENLRIAQNQERAASDKLAYYVAEHSRRLMALRNPQNADKTALANAEHEARILVEAAREEAEKATQNRIHAEASYAHIHASLKMPAQENSVAQLALWQGRVEEAQNRLYEATVAAPLSGIVQNFSLGKGEYIAGDQAIGLISPLITQSQAGNATFGQNKDTAPGLWVRAAFDANTFPKLQAGLKASVKLENGTELQGNIQSLAPLDDGSGEARVQILELPENTMVYPGQMAEVSVRIR